MPVEEIPSNQLSSLLEVGYLATYQIGVDSLIRFCKSLGPITFDPRDPGEYRDIAPQKVHDAKPNTLSSRYGTEAFPFHTDVAHWETPARFLVLHCLSVGKGSRPTFIKDAEKFCLSPADRFAILNEVWKRGLAKPKLCTVGRLKDGQVSFRFDMDCMSPMTMGASLVKENLNKHIHHSPSVSINWEVGLTLVVDNWRCLHARGSSPVVDADRVLRRITIGGNNGS